jgi:hypothetical protein
MERVFNGALSLLSILIAVFTFSILQYVQETGRAEAQLPYRLLTMVTGLLVIGSGIIATAAHLKIGAAGLGWLYYGFAAVLVVATVSPLMLYFFL